MKKFINKAMLTLVVFGLAIVSSFGMETDPPTEPVKPTVETEVLDNMEQPTFLVEGYGYKITPTQCVLISEGSPGTDCLTINPGPVCTQLIGGVNQNIYYMHFDDVINEWVCGEPFRKPKVEN